MKFCNSHLTRNIFNQYMRRFFFGLVYVVKYGWKHYGLSQHNKILQKVESLNGSVVKRQNAM